MNQLRKKYFSKNTLEKKVLFMVWGRAIFRSTFSNSYGIMSIYFTIYRHLTELWVPFSGDFLDFPELWPRFSFDYGIMTLKSTRIYGIMGTNFSGKTARPRQMIGRDTPLPGRVVPIIGKNIAIGS